MNSVLAPAPLKVPPPTVGVPPQPAPRDDRGAWRALGWFGLLLTVVSASDQALTWYPLELGRSEWEFGTIAASYSSLPLLTTGLAALLGSALALRRRWAVWSLAIVLQILALAMAGATLLFLLDVPLALRFAPAEVMLGIQKTVAKTLVIGVLFPIAFQVAAIAAVRAHSSTRKR